MHLKMLLQIIKEAFKCDSIYIRMWTKFLIQYFSYASIAARIATYIYNDNIKVLCSSLALVQQNKAYVISVIG